MPAPVTQAQKTHYIQLRQELGFSKSRAAKEAGVSRSWATQFEKNYDVIQEAQQQKQEEDDEKIPDPKEWVELDKTPHRALEEFNFFRYHYYARDMIPWAEDAAQHVLGYLNEPNKTYVVINCPPGSGKTTLFTHDLVLWLVARDRTIRTLVGSHSMTMAKFYTRRLRLSFERPNTFVDRETDREAEGVLCRDFGRFKPDHQDLWRSEEMVVEQVGGVAPGEKEPTVMSASEDSGFLGGRFEFSIWDDLVTVKNQSTPVRRDNQQEFWTDQAETRCEPGGLVVLMGQRINASDLFRYCLDMKIPRHQVEKKDIEGKGDRKYYHVVYPAHFNEVCKENHDDPKPWPNGCLLDPYRLPFHELEAIRENDEKKYQTVYQQHDADPESVLVQQHWIDGGEHNGILYPGCKDPNRTIAQWPEGMGRCDASVITVDPSPEEFWSVQWWGFNQDSDTRVLLDHANRRMRAPQFLDRLQDGSYVGLLKDWCERAWHLSMRINYLIVEQNAAQRFMVQYDYFQQFLKRWGVLLMPHDTTKNKADQEWGVWALLPNVYRTGKINLPYHDLGRKASSPLVQEATKWPDSGTDDCVDAQWFFEFNLPRIRLKGQGAPKRQNTPSWLGKRVGAK